MDYRVDERGMVCNGGTFQNIGPSVVHIGRSAADPALEVGGMVSVVPGASFVCATGQWTILREIGVPHPGISTPPAPEDLIDLDKGLSDYVRAEAAREKAKKAKRAAAKAKPRGAVPKKKPARKGGR